MRLIFLLSCATCAVGLLLHHRGRAQCDIVAMSFAQGSTISMTSTNRDMIFLIAHAPSVLEDQWRVRWTITEPSVFGVRDAWLESHGERHAFHALRAHHGGIGATRNEWFLALTVPMWLICAISLAPALFVVWIRRRRIARMTAGLCENCGYDTRFCSGRCSECGTATEFPTASASAI